MNDNVSLGKSSQNVTFKNTVCIYTIDDIILIQQYSKTTSNTFKFTICITTTQKIKYLLQTATINNVIAALQINQLRTPQHAIEFRGFYYNFLAMQTSM